jgi:glycosyltransferase involved in cell wall biosynthesis
LKVLFVSSHDLVGQQFNGYLLLDALRKKQIDARMFAYHSQADRPGVVYKLGSKSRVFLNRGLSFFEKQLSLYSIFPVLSLDIMGNRFYQEADIVHLQLIHAARFFSLLSLPKMGRQKKLVLTLHDPWMVTGHCVHPIECERWKTGCGCCPDLKRPFPIKMDTTSLMWGLKKRLFNQTSVHLIVASKWMDQLVANSPILSRLPRTIIPFGLDTRVFKPSNRKASRKSLGIPEDAFVVGFRAAPFSPFKGGEYIEKALLTMSSKKPICLITFDSIGQIPNLSNKFKTIELGWVFEPEKIATALNAADLFLMPSIAEAFGMMAIESMACGTPVIAFEGTALPAVIHAPRGGLAVPSRDGEALRTAIESLMNNRDLYENLVLNGLRIVKEEYGIDKNVTSHLELYAQLMEANFHFVGEQE